jgi:hypothetical protein
VTVRKHVVTILRNMCLGQPHHSLVPTICKKLVTRIGDEDESIKVRTVLSQRMFCSSLLPTQAPMSSRKRS